MCLAGAIVGRRFKPRINFFIPRGNGQKNTTRIKFAVEKPGGFSFFCFVLGFYVFLFCFLLFYCGSSSNGSGPMMM